MTAGSFIYKISAGFTACAGAKAMNSDHLNLVYLFFHPMYLLFHLTLIILTSMTIGFLAETRFKNYMKNKYDRLGERYI